MPTVPLSLIVPTRGRPESLGRLLASLAATAADPLSFEVVLVVDADAVPPLDDCELIVRQVVGPPGRTMGELNTAGCEAARGDYLMLLNDDVVARTPGWDDRLLEAAGQFADGIVLVHVNDTLMRHHLCTFPLVSRIACALMGGICPREYRRYRIDDHIEDCFNLLGLLGERRTVYLPDVVFEHANAVEMPGGVREYHADPAILALDAPLFDALLPRRKEIALRFGDHIDAQRCERQRRLHQDRLGLVADSTALRVPSRQRVAPPAVDAPSRPHVGFVILTYDPAAPLCRDQVGTILATGLAREIHLISHPAEASLARRLNDVFSSSAADFLVVLEDVVRLPQGWLARLLACATPGVAAVTPLLRRRGGPVCGGLVFAPDGSGHHGAWTLPPPGVVPAFSFRSPVVLLDRGRVAQVGFDESYGRYFLDCDLGLRLWEYGWQIVVTPEVVAEVSGGPLPYAEALDEASFEADRRRFVAAWTETGRFERLCRGRWQAIESLRHWLRLGQKGPAGASELAAMRHCPILLPHLQPRREPAKPGRLAVLLGRLRRCWADRGFWGVVHAAAKRVMGARRYVAQSVIPQRKPFPVNPTREAAEYPGR